MKWELIIKELSQCILYMYADKLERVEFICPDYLFDDICEWFGTDFDAERISPVDEEKAQEDKLLMMCLLGCKYR